jgi:hypothetical protein
MKKDKSQQMMLDELEDAGMNLAFKHALLQKYGLMEVKLNQSEKKLIREEAKTW